MLSYEIVAALNLIISCILRDETSISRYIHCTVATRVLLHRALAGVAQNSGTLSERVNQVHNSLLNAMEARTIPGARFAVAPLT